MKVGILGAGKIAVKMAETLNGMDDAVCYAIASRDSKKAEAFAKEFGVEKAYGSYEELVSDPEVELIYVATPHSHHYQHAKLCIEHGKPVLCEKAFTANARQARELLAFAKEKGVFITEAIWVRYMPSRKMLEEIIAGGEIGEITSVTANLGYDIQHVERMQRPELAGGALLDVGIYPLSFISMVLGDDVKNIVSTCTKTATGVDEQNVMILEYDGGKLATAHSGMLAATEQYGIIYGTKGYIIAENINNIDKIKIYTPDRKLVREVHAPGQITGYEYEVRASMQAIREGKLECPEMPHAETIVMMELMDKIRYSWGIKYPFED